MTRWIGPLYDAPQRDPVDLGAHSPQTTVMMLRALFATAAFLIVLTPRAGFGEEVLATSSDAGLPPASTSAPAAPPAAMAPSAPSVPVPAAPVATSPAAAVPAATPAPAAPEDSDRAGTSKPAVEAADLPADAPDDPSLATKIDEAARELEEMQADEDAAVDTEATLATEVFRILHSSGAASPLQQRLSDALDAARGLPLAPNQAEIEAAKLAAVGSFDIERARPLYDIPVEMQPLVAEYIRYFQTRGRKHFVKWVSRASRYMPMMRKALREAGLPEDTIFLSMIESGFSSMAYSRARASGMWQFIEPTGRRFGLKVDFWVDQRRDPVKATTAAAGYLEELYTEFGDWRLAWAGYNAGAGKIRKAKLKDGSSNFWDMVQGRTLKKETKHYVPKLMAAALVFKHLKAFGFSESEFDPMPPLVYEEAEVPEATDLEVIARAAGVTVDQIKDLNPELRRWCTPPARGKDDVYKIRLPVGTGPQFAENFAKIAPKDRLTFRVHRVVRGDTLSRIAVAYGSAPEAIMRMNGLRDSRRLKLNADLVVPVPRTGTREALAVQARRRGFTAAPAEQEVPAAPPVRRSNGSVAAGSVRTVKENGRTKVLYGVASGDSLWTIAQHFKVTVEQLRAWNDLRARRPILHIGQELAIYPPAGVGL